MAAVSIGTLRPPFIPTLSIHARIHRPARKVPDIDDRRHRAGSVCDVAPRGPIPELLAHAKVRRTKVRWNPADGTNERTGPDNDAHRFDTGRTRFSGIRKSHCGKLIPMATMKKPEGSVEANAFRDRLSGAFQGVMQWHQLDMLWERIRNGQWFVYQTNEPPPERPLAGEPLAARIDSLDKQLRHDHRYDYCGIVYVDDAEAPTLVKIYDPSNLGSSCSHGATPIPPRWILSTALPASIDIEVPAPENRWRLWRRPSH